MIKSISVDQLQECLNILKKSYEDIAIRFWMTEENCPFRGRTLLPYNEFEKEFNTGYLMYGYFNKNRIVGFLSLFPKDDIINIHDLAILPEYQCNGFGSELMQFTKDKAKKFNYKKIELGMVDNNKKLKNWYEKQGFKTVKLLDFEKVTYKVGIMELDI